MPDERESPAVSTHVEELDVAGRIYVLEAEVARLTDELLAQRCRAEVREDELEREVRYLRATRRYLVNAVRAVVAEDADYAKGSSSAKR